MRGRGRGRRIPVSPEFGRAIPMVESEDAMTLPGIDSLVNMALYPLDDDTDPRFGAVVEEARRQLAADGCACLKGFLGPDGLAAIAAEMEALAPRAYYTPHEYNTIHGREPDLGFPEGHPRQVAHRFAYGVVTRDGIPDDTAMIALYRHRGFQRLLAACLDLPRIHESADPLRSVALNIMPDGGEFGWHYDASEFTLSLVIKSPKSGGEFEYYPNVRQLCDDKNYEIMRTIFEGSNVGVKKIRFGEGDIHIFRGKNTVHRVNKVSGQRYSIIMCYSSAEGFVGKSESSRRFYGSQA